MAKRPLPDSARPSLPTARATAKADPAERLEVTLLLRRCAGPAFDAHLEKLNRDAAGVPHLARAEYAKRFGATAADLAAVEAFAAAHGLAVVQKEPARCTVIVAGTVAQCNAAFGVDLQHIEHDGGTYRSHSGTVHLPEALHGVVQAVLGLDNRPQARPHFRLRRPDTAIAHPHATPAATFTPPQLAERYEFPAGDGAGQTIALIEFGGGYRPADLRAYFTGLGLPMPQVSAVSVDHAGNQPSGDANGPDGEVTLDLEVAGAIAPAAKLVVYFAPNTDAGFLNAITTAVHDTTHQPSIISISWGGPESAWTAQSMQALNSALQTAASMGITVCVACGDSGSSDGVGDGAQHVDFPASSPYALACGGTSLAGARPADAKGKGKGKAHVKEASAGSAKGHKSTQLGGQEAVWNDGTAGGSTGGGVSRVFAVPAWQKGLQATATAGGAQALRHRGVPDVAADADPQSGYEVLVDGERAVVGGTSAVAPLWAGLIARINAIHGAAGKGAAGFINPKLYQAPPALHDITQGNNGAFAAAPGWDACTGLGSPNGAKIADAV